MEKNRLLEAEETHICQVGVVVKDLDRTIEHLTSLGLVSYQVRIAMARQGAVQLELIEYQKGTTIQKDFLDQKGEGIHHVLFNVRSLDKALGTCKQRGIEVLQQDRFVGGGGLAYLGTDQPGGIIFEVVQRPPDYDPEKGVRYE